MVRTFKLVAVAAVVVAVALAAGPAGADWNAGIQLYNEGRFADAMEYFQATVKSNPNWPGGYLMLGRCQLALKQYDEALVNLRRSVELGPDDPANVATLSRALMAVDRHAEARELLEGLDFETLSPEWKTEVARMLARCLIVEDRAGDAVALLEARLVDDPENSALHQAVAGAHQAAGDRAAAVDHFARAFAINPSDHFSARAATTTALSLAAAAGDDAVAAGYHRRALEIATQLATAAPDYENALLAGEAALGARQPEAAAEWFAAAVQSRPQEPLARFYLGRTLAALDHDDQAVTHLRAGLGAAPDDELAVRIHGQLARLLACDLELGEAARHYRAAGDSARAAEIEVLAASFNDALERLAKLRRDVTALAGMEAEVEALGDANGVAALAGRREAMSREIAAIEANLSEVRSALCR